MAIFKFLINVAMASCLSKPSNVADLKSICEQAMICQARPNGCGEDLQACLPESKNKPGSEVVNKLLALSGEARENQIYQEFQSGGFPSGYAKFRNVSLSVSGDETIEIRVAPDYLAVGTNDDSVLMPMTNGTAQKLADQWGMILPTSRMVDAIYYAASQKLNASPLGASKEMTSTQMYLNSNRKIQERTQGVPYGEFRAGHKKDVVLSPKPGNVSIYGWAGKDRGPRRMPYIQPEGGPHDRGYVDYSHGIRMVSQWVQIKKNGVCRVIGIKEALLDPKYCSALSYRCPLKASEISADPR